MDKRQINYASALQTIEECRTKYIELLEYLSECKEITTETKKIGYRRMKEIKQRKAYLQYLQDVIKVEVQRIRNGYE